MAGFEQDSLIEELKKQKVDLYSILAVCLLTDGSMQVKNNSFRLAYASQDRRLLSILWSLMNELSDYLPIVTGFQIFTIRLSDKELGEKLAGLCPNYKTSPVHYEKINDYLATPQPSLSFLEAANMRTKRRAIRFGFSADGCVSFSKYNKPEINLACHHPTLVYEWKRILQRVGINAKIARSKNSWCNITGVRFQDMESIKKFYKLGGFLDGVKISRKSKKFTGMEKNALLEKIINGNGRIRTADLSVSE